MNNNKIITKVAFLVTFVILLWHQGFSQSAPSQCDNSDFAFGNFSNWLGFYGGGAEGYAGGINGSVTTPVAGFEPGRHQIISAPGTDPNTCGGLQMLPPGVTRVAKLGNDVGLNGAEKLRYQINPVTPGNALFIYNYAIVYENPCSGHSCGDMPAFSVKVTNGAGQLVDPNCANYNYKPCNCGASAGTFGTCGGWKYLTWKTAALDLTAYMGQIVNIDFQTNDCGQGGHAGYAYLYGACQALIIDVAYCSGSNQVLLSAPAGFVTYSWTRAAAPAVVLGTAQDLTVSNPIIGDQYVCSVTTFAGCTITLTSQIQPSIVIADYDNTTACAGELVNFYDLSSVNNSSISSWDWDFGDGTPNSLLQNPTHAFANGGTYDVTLIAGSNAGCTETITKQITVTARPDAQFTVTNACVGVPATFVNGTTTNSAIASNSWDFNYNNAVSLATSPTYTYSLTGTYNVRLIATDNNGCKDTVINPITISPLPIPNFTNPNICVGVPATFTDASSSAGGAISSVSWLFGNPPIANGLTATHTYNIPGNQNITITATDVNGCIGSAVVPVVVNALPQPSFTNTTECVGIPTVFTDATIAPGGGVASWTWDFGDGSALSNIQNPNSLYANEGNYTVSLSVVDGVGCTNSISQSVHVGNIPSADFTFVESCLGQSTCFTDNSTTSLDPILNYNWDFGTVPVSTSTQSDPCFPFVASGTYQVGMSVTTNIGCQSPLVTKAITVHEMPVPDFTFTSVCAGFQTDFTDASTIPSGTIINWDWTFGTSPQTQALSIQNPNKIYSIGGNYPVRITVTSDFGCTSSLTKQVIVYPKPFAKFTTSAVCEGIQNNFSSNSTIANPDNIVQFDWDFNNGEGTDFGTNQNPQFIFSSYGVKPVKLTVTSDNGCVDDTIRNTLIYSVPQTDFDFTNVCAGFPITLNNLTTNADGAFSTNWNFATPFISFPYNTQTSPTVTYNTAGPYDVLLKTTSIHGCVGEITKTINIFPIPLARFSSPAVCFKNDFVFNDSSVVSNLFNDVISIWDWNFGDGPPAGIDSVQNPNYFYQNYGSYTVNLTVTTNNGCTNSTFKDVVIYPVPTVKFQADPTCETQVTTFYNTTQMVSDGLISDWNWDFDGLGSSTDSSVTFLFPNDGTYDVTLSATTDKNCTVDTTIPVIVNPLPVVNFVGDSLLGCQPLSVTFEDLTPNPVGYTVSQWQWNFGDAHFSNQHPRANNPYDTYGDFNVQLILTTSEGCKDSLTLANYVTVWPKPIANFSIDPQPTGELNAWITFTDQSELEVNSWWWDFGVRDSITDISTAQNPVYQYPDSGTYISVLMVENRYGCRDTLQRPVIINPEFIFYIPNAFTPQDSRDDLNEVFNGYGTGIQDYDMRIYNRWGENVYHSKDPKLGWNGKVRKSNELAQQDVYVYVFKILDVNQIFHIYRGHVTLVRSR